MIPKTMELLRQFDKGHIRVIVPSIVIGEFLLGIPVAQHAAYQQLIGRRFMVVSYDLLASLEFARIWQKKKEEQVIQEMRQSGTSRREIRADAMIVATARAAGATHIYSHDDDIRQIAADVITYRDIADVMVQSAMVDENGNVTIKPF